MKTENSIYSPRTTKYRCTTKYRFEEISHFWLKSCILCHEMTVSPKPDLFLTRKSTSTPLTLHLRNPRRDKAQFSSFEILKF